MQHNLSQETKSLSNKRTYVCVSSVSNLIMWCLIIFYVSVFIKKTTFKTDSECRHFFVIHKQYKKSYTLMILKTRIK